MTEGSRRAVDYSKVGVDTGKEESGLRLLVRQLEQTLANRPADSVGHVQLPFGYFANVIRLTGETGLAISTDGAGTKVLVAQMVGRYDTIGIDCIAMNVNDLLCVGAEPITEGQLVAKAPRVHRNQVQVVSAPSGTGLAEPVHLFGQVGRIEVAKAGERPEAGTGCL